MTDTTDLTQLIGLFRLNTRLYRLALDGVSGEDSLVRAGGDANHIAFIALHLLDARTYTANLLGEPSLSHAFEALVEGARGIDDIPSFPPPDEMLEPWSRISEELDARLADQTPASLAADSGAGFPNGDSRVHGAISFLALHEGYHLGQLGLLRKVVGLDAIDFTAAAPRTG